MNKVTFDVLEGMIGLAQVYESEVESLLVAAMANDDSNAHFFPSDPLEQYSFLFNNIVVPGCYLKQDNLEHCLQMVLSMEKECQRRLDGFLIIYSVLVRHQDQPLEINNADFATHELLRSVSFNEDAIKDRRLLDLMRAMSTDEAEPAIFRAFACYIVGTHHESRKAHEPAEAALDVRTAWSLLQDAATHCDAERSLGQHRISLVVNVPGLLFMMKTWCEEKIFDLKCINHFAGAFMESKKTGGALAQPGAAFEFVRQAVSSSTCTYLNPDAFYPRPPEITTTILEEVKALPEVNETFFIYQDPQRLTEADILSEIASELVPGKLLDSLKQGPAMLFENASEELKDRLENGVDVRVYKVDLDRFRGGKTTKVFEEVMHLTCHKQSSHLKNLLSALVMACQHPYRGNLVLMNTGHHPEKRPQKILFESEEDITHPQIVTFLPMMGFTDIGAADPELLELLKDRDSIRRSRRTSKEESPYMYDMERGISCGNCGLVGPNLRICACGKAFYCGDECQNARWKGHKNEHKKAMRKMARTRPHNA